MEEQGRTWLVSRASSTDLVALNEPEDDEEMYHRYSRDLEIFEIGATYLDDEDEEIGADGGQKVNWWRWVRTFMEFGEEDDEEEIEWEIPKKNKSVSFAEGTKGVDESVVQRARERDEEHGLDGWMDGAAYLAFLGVRAFGGFF